MDWGSIQSLSLKKGKKLLQSGEFLPNICFSFQQWRPLILDSLNKQHRHVRTKCIHWQHPKTCTVILDLELNSACTQVLFTLQTDIILCFCFTSFCTAKHSCCTRVVSIAESHGLYFQIMASKLFCKLFQDLKNPSDRDTKIWQNKVSCYYPHAIFICRSQNWLNNGLGVCNKKSTNSDFMEPVNREEICFMSCTCWHKMPLLKYLKGSLLKGHTFHKYCQRLERSGNRAFLSLSSLPRDLFIQLMRNVAELTSSSKSHWSQDGISLHNDTCLLCLA